MLHSRRLLFGRPHQFAFLATPALPPSYENSQLGENNTAIALKDLYDVHSVLQAAPPASWIHVSLSCTNVALRVFADISYVFPAASTPVGMYT